MSVGRQPLWARHWSVWRLGTGPDRGAWRQSAGAPGGEKRNPARSRPLAAAAPTLPTPPIDGLQLISPMDVAGLGVTSSTRAPRRAAAAAASQPACAGWAAAWWARFVGGMPAALAWAPALQRYTWWSEEWHGLRLRHRRLRRSAAQGAERQVAAAPACPPPTTTTSASREAFAEHIRRLTASLSASTRPPGGRVRPKCISAFTPDRGYRCTEL